MPASDVNPRSPGAAGTPGPALLGLENASWFSETASSAIIGQTLGIYPGNDGAGVRVMAGGSESEIEALEQDVREAAERLAQAAREYKRAAGRPSPYLRGREAPGIEQAQIADAKVFAHRVAMLSA